MTGDRAVDRASNLHEDLRRVLTAYRDTDESQLSVREAMLAFLAARPDAARRSCVPGHFTASALVVDPSRRAVLLTLHPRVGRWLQVGGHLEDDPSTVDAARREAVEESGIADLVLDPEPLHLAVHPITCSLGVPTRHLDIRLLAVAPAGAEPVISAESLDLRWFPHDALPDPLAADLPELTRRALARLS
ncbi:MAG TPA: NUDIX hydrolase [Mycobacteriales bacterium]|nr:NUDIX hydrolase [Mycobacteriales bacterium]